MVTTNINVQFSDEAVKAIVIGGVALGFLYLIYKVSQNASDKQIPLPAEAKDIANSSEVSPKSIDDIGYHAGLRERVEPLFRGGHFVSAVRESCVALFDIVREKSGIKGDGAELIGRVFRSKDKTLVFTNPGPNHVKVDDASRVEILIGFTKMIRNLHMHATIEISKEQALQQINMACYLADQVENYTICINGVVE